MQHFLRFLVCNNISFRVSSSKVSSSQVWSFKPAFDDTLTVYSVSSAVQQVHLTRTQHKGQERLSHH
jgi:hypothetical protein